MQKMGRKILMSYDGSDLTEKIIEEVKVQTERYNDSEIHILSVVTQVGPASHPGVALSIEKELAENIREELKPIVQELTDAGYNAKAEVIVDQRQRNAGHKVVEYAEEEAVDLIVIGNRGLGNISGLFLGSVSSQVIQHASCHVLVVK